MADIKKTIEILFEGNDQASKKAGDVAAAIKGLETPAGTAATELGKVSGSLDNIGSPKQLTAMNTAATAMAAFVSSIGIKAFIDANVEIEKLERGFNAIKGDTAAREMAFVKEAANRMGLDVGEAGQAFLKLTAAAKGSSSEGLTYQIFEQVSRAIIATGGSSNSAGLAFNALAQMMSKGKVTAEELKGQLADSLPGALGLSATALGVTKGEFEKMLEKGIDVNEFLPKFVKVLNDTYGDKVRFDGYESNLARTRNAVKDLLVEIGKTGAFELLTEGLEGATSLTKFLTVEFKSYGEAYEAVARFMRTGGTWDGLKEDLERSVKNANALKRELSGENGLNQTLAETQRLMRGESAAWDSEFASNQSDAETSRLKRYEQDAKDAEEQAKKLNEVLKALGVDPKKTDEGVQKIAGLLKDLAENPKSNGTDFVLAVDASLKKISTSEQISTIKTTVENLFKDGKIDATTYQKALADIDAAAGKLGGSGGGLDKTKKAAEDAAKAAEKAEEQARKWALEMEKIASNERIKLIEAKVQLDIANVQEQTKRIQAAFESLDNTITSTGDLLGKLFGESTKENLSFRQQWDLEKQIEKENERRDEALALQKDLVMAQIANLRASAQAMNNQDALIKVDGAGLQPHLEAIMWEILKQIQMRVNQQGLSLLMGL